MPNTRVRSYHIGLEGQPYEAWTYRIMGSYTHHWGSIFDPLVTPEGVTSMLLEFIYAPIKYSGWQFVGSLASDNSNLIGNNIGVMITIRKIGSLVK